MKLIDISNSGIGIDKRIIGAEQTDPDGPAIVFQLPKNRNYQIGIARTAGSASARSKNVESGSAIGRGVRRPVCEMFADRVWSVAIAYSSSAPAVKPRARTRTRETICNADYSSSINPNLIIYDRNYLCAGGPCEASKNYSQANHQNNLLHSSFLSLYRFPPTGPSKCELGRTT